MIRRHLVIRGRVQGVSYRWGTMIEAERLGLTGWVKNLPDGSVEAEAEGPADALDALIAWCHDGPDWATVTSVDVTEVEPEGSTRFRITD